MFGRLLRVDMDRQRISSEPIPLELRRKYLGGEGINSRLLWEHFLEVDPRIDPLSPQNVLIAGVGPLGALGLGGTKMKWTFKSPAYGIFGDSASGGGFPAALRWAGYDHLVVTGRAERPVYLWIDDDRVELRDAARLWGKDVERADGLIKEELGDEDIETACVGRAAENGVAFASIAVSRHRGAGRCGAGSVLASKNLKAIAVRGTRGIALRDPKRFMQVVSRFQAAAERFPRAADGWRKYGTLSGTSWYQRIGVNAYRNNQFSTLPEDRLPLLTHHWYIQNLAQGALSCSPGCILACGGWYRIKGNESPMAAKFAGETGYRSELGGVAAFGIMCDLSDMPAVFHLWKLCREYGMDVLEMGACCAFLMELWQRGIITEKDTQEWLGEPLSLEWGNFPALVKVIEAIALQNNPLGRIFRSGVYRAAQQIEELKGTAVLPYALYGKGGAGFIEDIRNTASWATNAAVAARGCDHLKGFGTLDKVNRPDISEFYFRTPEGADPLTITLKGASSAVCENRCAMLNSLGVCLFLVAPDPLTFPNELFAAALESATGFSLKPEELLVAGERTVNLEKAFNSRLGLRRQDDTLCQRWLKEEIRDGAGKGWKGETYLEKTKDEYYAWHGWDGETSLQTEGKLRELDLLDVARVLKGEGALV